MNENVLKRNIEILADTMTKIMFGLLGNDHAIFTGDYKALQSGHLEQLIHYLKANSRIPTNLVKGSNTMKELSKIFYKAMPNTTTQPFEYKETEFSTNTPAKMKIIKSKSRLFDMFLFIVIVAYLFILYLYMAV